MTTYSQLYDDFRMAILNYTERITITPLYFMRLCTQGISLFQRTTYLAREGMMLERDVERGGFFIDIPVHAILSLADDAGVEFLRGSPESLVAANQYDKLVLPPEAVGRRQKSHFLHKNSSGKRQPRFYAFINGHLTVSPDLGDKYLYALVAPAFPPISEKAKMWEEWFADDLAFEEKFYSEILPYGIEDFAHAFVHYAVAEHLLYNQSYDAAQAHRILFEQERERAKQDAANLGNNLTMPYRMAPFS